MRLNIYVSLMLATLMLYAPYGLTDTPKELEDLLVATYAPATAQAKKISKIIQTYAQSGSSKALRYGDKIRLRHTATNQWLHALNQPYQTNPQPGQLMAVTDSSQGSWWIIKGGHVDGQRFGSTMWMPLTLNGVLRLEHEGLGYNLHSQANLMAPLAAQVSPDKELLAVSIAGAGGMGDTNDNWKLQEVYGATEVAKGYSIKLLHTQTNNTLHSDILKYPNGFQEVATCPNPTDTNNWWTADDIIPSMALDLTVYCALYGDLSNGASSKKRNVSEKLDAMSYNGVLRFPVLAVQNVPSSSLASTFGVTNPNPNTIKNIAIVYCANSMLYFHLAASEYDIIALPNPNDPKIFNLSTIDQAQPSFKILYAVYGDLNCTAIGKNGGTGIQQLPYQDVTDKVQGMVTSNQIIFTTSPKSDTLNPASPTTIPSLDAAGNPIPAPAPAPETKSTDPDITKSLLLIYQVGNRIYMHILGETEPALISPANAGQSTLVYAPSKGANLPTQFQMEIGSGKRISVGSNNGVLEAFVIAPDKTEVRRYNAYNLTTDPWSVLNVPIGPNTFIKSFKDVAISSDNVLCILDGNGKAYRYNSQKKLFIKLVEGPGNESLVLDYIAVGNTKDLWGVDTKSKTIYEYDTINNKWVARVDQSGVYVTAGIDGSVIIINQKDEAVLFDGTSWQPLTGSKVDRVALATKNSIWGIRNGQLLMCVGGKWRGVKGSDGRVVTDCSEIAINAAGTIFVITTDGVIYFKGDTGFSVTKIASIKGGKKVQIFGRYITPQYTTRSKAMTQGQIVLDTKLKTKTQKLNKILQRKASTAKK